MMTYSSDRNIDSDMAGRCLRADDRLYRMEIGSLLSKQTVLAHLREVARARDVNRDPLALGIAHAIQRSKSIR